MSTPNPTHIIAEAVRDGLYEHDAETIAAYVVSELTDAGYSIVPTDWRPPAEVYKDAADVPVRTVIWWPADKTVAARFDKTNGVVLGDDRPFRWSVINGPVTVLFQEDTAVGEKP